MQRLYSFLLIAICSALCSFDCSGQGYLGNANRITLSGATTANFQTLYIPSFHGGLDYVRTLNRNTEIGATMRIKRGHMFGFTLRNEQSWNDVETLRYEPKIKGGNIGVYLNSYLYGKYSSVAPIGFYIQYGLDFNEWHLGEDINAFGKPKSVSGYQLMQFSFLSMNVGFGQQAVWGDRLAAGWIMRTNLPIKFFKEPEPIEQDGYYLSNGSFPITNSPISLIRYTALTLEFSLGYFF